MHTMEMVGNTVTGTVGGVGKGFISSLGGIFLVGIAAKTFKILERVPKGHVALKLRNGSPIEINDPNFGIRHKTLGPGLHFLFKHIHDFDLVNVLPQQSSLGELIIESDDRQRVLESTAIWRVREDQDSPYKAHYHISKEDLTETVVKNCRSSLTAALAGASLKELQDRATLDQNVKDISRVALSHYGVELQQLIIENDYEVQSQVSARILGKAIRGESDDTPILAKPVAAYQFLESPDFYEQTGRVIPFVQ